MAPTRHRSEGAPKTPTNASMHPTRDREGSGQARWASLGRVDGAKGERARRNVPVVEKKGRHGRFWPRVESVVQWRWQIGVGGSARACPASKTATGPIARSLRGRSVVKGGKGHRLHTSSSGLERRPHLRYSPAMNRY